MKRLICFLLTILALSLPAHAIDRVDSSMVVFTNAMPDMGMPANSTLRDHMTNINAKFPTNISKDKVYTDTDMVAAYGFATTGAVTLATGTLAGIMIAGTNVLGSNINSRLLGTNFNDATYDPADKDWTINWGGKTGVWQVIEYAVYTNPTAMTKYSNSMSAALDTASNWVLQAGNQNGNLSLTNGNSQLVVPARTVAIMYASASVFTKWTNTVDITAYLIRGGGATVGTMFIHDKEADQDTDVATPTITKKWSSVNGMVMCRPTASDKKYSLRASLLAGPGHNLILRSGIAWKQWQVILFQLNTDDPAE